MIAAARERSVEVKARDIRDLSDNELQDRLKERRDDLIAFRLQMATGSVENVRAARNARRDIARILTVMKERQAPAQEGNE